MSQIEQDIKRQQIATRTEALQVQIGRATQQTTNSFGAIVAEATSLRAAVVASTEHDETDVAYIDAQISGLATVVSETAESLLALLPSGD